MSEFRHIGKVRRRQDGRAIVTGKALYCDDLPIKNCKYAKVLHSPYPHAEIRTPRPGRPACPPTAL